MLDVRPPAPLARAGIETPAAAAYSAWSPAPLVRASLLLHGAAALGFALRPGAWPWAAGAVLANHALIAAAGLWPQSPLLGPVLARLPDGAARQGLVALTFDDGPDPAVTPSVLGLLAAHGATASFFCVGRRARAEPALVREIARAGHSIENHTDRHPFGFAFYGLGRLGREIAAAQASLAALAGAPPRFFRAPMGFRSPLLDPVLHRAGLAAAAWTRRGHDCFRRDPGVVLRHLTRGLRGGDILLLHDGSCARTVAGEPVVLAVLPRLLAALRAQGLRAVSLPRAMAAD